jgi:hypothetical protein
MKRNKLMKLAEKYYQKYFNSNAKLYPTYSEAFPLRHETHGFRETVNRWIWPKLLDSLSVENEPMSPLTIYGMTFCFCVPRSISPAANASSSVPFRKSRVTFDSFGLALSAHVSSNNFARRRQSNAICRRFE